MRLSGLLGFCMSVVFVISAATTVRAQSPEPQPETRQSTIENAAAEKAKSLHPYEVTFAEKVIAGIERRLTNQTIRWHPYFQNAYSGRRLCRRPRIHRSHQRLQHPRRSRELQHQLVQARRGRIRLAAPVRPAR